MKLQKILIINRAPFDNLELNFDNEQVIVLSGINGAGKTTIISYIVDAFYELAKKGFTQEFENKNTKYYRISSNLFSVDSSKMSAVYLRFKLEDGRSADYIDIRGSCSQDDYDELIKISDKIDYSKIERHLTKNRVEKYWTISDSKEIDNLFSNNLLTYFPAYRYETPYYLNDPYKIQLSFNKDMTFTGYLTNPIEVTSDLPEIANWIMDIVLDQYVYRRDANNAISELNSILSNILFNKVQCRTRVGIGQRFSGARRISIMDADDVNHQVYPSIFYMSSGELAAKSGKTARQSGADGAAVRD